MPDHKEPHFFAYHSKDLDYRGPGDDWLNRAAVTGKEAYLDLFADAPIDAVTGEASAMYLYEERAAKQIREMCPGVRLVAVLRNPVDRAYSSFMHLRRDDREPLSSFRDALDAEDLRVQNGYAPLWHYRRMGLYTEQLARYGDMLDDGRLRVYLFDDLIANPMDVLDDVLHHIGVDPSVDLDASKRYNASGVARSQWLHNFVSRKHPVKEWFKHILPDSLQETIGRTIKSANLADKPRLPDNVRQELAAFYEPEIRRLQDVTGLDVSHWLQGASSEERASPT